MFNQAYEKMHECLNFLDTGKCLNVDEKENFRMLFTEFLEFCWEHEFIDKPDWRALEKFFEVVESRNNLEITLDK